MATKCSEFRKSKVQLEFPANCRNFKISKKGGNLQIKMCRLTFEKLKFNAT